MASIGKVILRRLLNRNCIGERYTRKQRVLSWGKHLPKEQRKAFVASYTKYKEQAWLLEKLKPDGTVVSLNPAKLKEIKEEL